MKGPWYTIEEALDILQLRYSELLHHLENQDILACLYTKKRHLMAVTPMAKQAPEGLATLHYHGHLTFSSRLILQLLDEDEYKLSPYCTLLEENKISNWKTKYPYNETVPNGSVSAWYPVMQDKEDQEKYYVPFKEEKNHAFSTMAKTFGNASSDAAKESWPKEGKELYQELSSIPKIYSATNNEKWNKRDIRIARSEIKRFQSPTQEALAIDASTKGDGQRSSLLHNLVLRIMQSVPDIAPVGIWKAITTDFHDLDIPLYDSGNIIKAIDAKELTWESDYGHIQTFKKKSLASLVSRLKKSL